MTISPAHPLGAWRTMTMIGAIALDGWRGFATIDAPTDGDVFAAVMNEKIVVGLVGSSSLTILATTLD